MGIVLHCALMGCTDAPAASPMDTGVTDAVISQDARDASTDITRAQPDVVQRPDGALEDVQCPTGDGALPCIHGVSGRVLDTSGAPLAGRVITLCGPACFIDQTGADGRFRVMVEDLIDLRIYSVSVHGRPEHGSLFIPVPAEIRGEVVFRDPMVLPTLTEVGPEMPDPARGGEVTAGEVTLTVPSGSMFDYDLEDVKLGARGRIFRVGYLPPTALPSFVPDALGTLYTFGPFNLASSRPLGLRVTNRAMLPAGSAVNFISMGSEVFAPPVNGGRPLSPIAGHVSADGRTISTDPGLGVSVLTWIAIRPRA